ncbi:MAG: IS1 family transposase [Betaproteobacteria bacterium]|nr:IS1 family transposase [Betaproteobacteria bacterium]
MNRLSLQDRTQILGCLVEGNSMRATARMCDVSFNTVSKLLIDVGSACYDYQDKTLRNLPCKRVQCDEIWSFCYAKERNVPEDKRGEFGIGDVYTWVAIDADTKLVPCWLVGKRDPEYAYGFIHDLSIRLANRIQLSTDGLKTYVVAVEGAFGIDIDYAMLVKLYGAAGANDERRYSPAECTGTMKRKIIGNPDEQHVSTSFVERQNLTMRMAMRRFTRLTNAFSKKIENHAHAVALHYMYYNFGRIHKTLRVTPAMQAGISDHVWSLEEITSLSD